jgi:hypothetical protein
LAEIDRLSRFSSASANGRRLRNSMDRLTDVDWVAKHLVDSIERGRSGEAPFYHLRVDRIFPDEIYAAMLREMPTVKDYRALPGRRHENILEDGSATRVKLDLFPEYIRRLSAKQRDIWGVVGRVLCSNQVKSAFVRRLAPGLERRFGAEFGKIELFPIPVLTRDVPRYKIAPHTDTQWKAITVQLYLPPDETTSHIGTIFHERLPDGSMRNAVKMPFLPNSGYAFAVGDNTWHSADPVGPEVKVRDSILLTYFVDSGLLRVLRNRGKRIGNLVLSEARSRFRWGAA